MSCDPLDREPLPEESPNQAGENHAPGERSHQSPTRTNLLQTRRRGTLSYIDEEIKTLHDQTCSELNDIRQRHEYLLERCAMTPFSRRESIPELHDAVDIYVAHSFDELEQKLEDAYEMALQGQSRNARQVIEVVRLCFKDLDDRNAQISSAIERLAEEGLARAL